MWVFKEHSLTGEKTPAENPPKEGFDTGVDSFVLIIRVCVSWESLDPEPSSSSSLRSFDEEVGLRGICDWYQSRLSSKVSRMS